jgi:hypothetical protein
MKIATVTGDVGNVCLDNLHVCKASCCRVFEVKTPCRVNSPLDQYYRVRGMKVKRLDRENIILTINHTCQHLHPETYLCGLHGTPRKPSLCCGSNAKTIKSGRYIKTEGCVLGD